MKLPANPSDNFLEILSDTAMDALAKVSWLFEAVLDADSIEQARGMAIIGKELAEEKNNRIDTLIVEMRRGAQQ